MFSYLKYVEAVSNPEKGSNYSFSHMNKCRNIHTTWLVKLSRNGKELLVIRLKAQILLLNLKTIQGKFGDLLLIMEKDNEDILEELRGNNKKILD
jgi:hypothetical protein